MLALFNPTMTLGSRVMIMALPMACCNEGRCHPSLGCRKPLAFMNDSLASHQEPVQAVS
jgi:hypothetical protein